MCVPLGSVTSIERRLFEVVAGAFPDAVLHHKIGRYVVDVYVPSARLAFEADGCLFHECPQHGKGRYPDRPDHDRVRDARLVESTEVEAVVRLWEHDIRNLGGGVSSLL